MPNKEIDDVAPGDVLGADVANGQGIVLAKAGTAVTEAHLRLLRMWGVLSVAVADPNGAAETPASVGDEDLARAEAKIKNCFGESLDNEIMAEILRVAVEMRAEKLAAGAIHDSE